ncbi:hypothetical protein [Kitasatospora sp. NPDC050543]|uniref:hypothetical protein n=1 Tax=Kitasatospora sp. NPDC050543 TaxID=3364054 RepID=UPI00378ABEA8
MSARSRSRLAVAVLGLAIAVSGCSQSSTTTGGKPTMEASTARDEFKALLDDTFAAITPQLTWGDDTFTVEPKQTFDNQDRDVAIAEQSRHVLTRLSEEKVGSLLGVVERRWKERGYTVDFVNPKAPSIQVHTPKGYQLDLVVGGDGKERSATFTVSVDKVKVTGERHPFGPGDAAPTDATGQPSWQPNVDDPFWSH